MATVNWLSIKLSYKLEIFKLMYNAHNYTLPSGLKCYYDEILMSCLSQRIIYISSL